MKCTVCLCCHHGHGEVLATRRAENTRSRSAYLLILSLMSLLSARWTRYVDAAILCLLIIAASHEGVLSVGDIEAQV